MIKDFKRGARVSTNFTADELMCKCTACQARGVTYLSEELIKMLQGFRDFLGKPINITANGGNRCTAWNKARGGATTSRHITWDKEIKKLLNCDGVDIWVDGIAPDDLAVMAEAYGFNGVGVYAASNRHIHVDVRPGTGARWWLQTSGSNTPGFGGKPCTFKQGHRSPAVTKIQAALNKAGYLTAKPDGKGTMDANSVKALKAYQFDNGLTADGAYGKGTDAKMRVFGW